MAYTRKMAGKVPVLKQDLVFDATPTAGSENAVTSGGVAESVAQQSSNIAEAFSASSTYAIGELVIGPDGKLYQCTTAVETAGEWDPEDWTETSMVDLIEQDMKDMEEMFLVNLPCAANTFRFEFSDQNYDPVVAGVCSAEGWTKVQTKYTNIWDYAAGSSSIGPNFSGAFTNPNNKVKVISAGTLSWEVMYQTFKDCTALESVCDLTCPNLTSLNGTFSGCTKLNRVPVLSSTVLSITNSAFSRCTSIKTIPLFKSLVLTNVATTFNECVNVESGAKAVYDKLAGQSTPPSTHGQCFYKCGSDTTTGAAELAQIPASWGGTGPEPSED